MENFQVVAYKSKKSDKFYLMLLCMFGLLLLPMAIHQKLIFEAILFGTVGLSCAIYLIVQCFQPKEKVKLSPNSVQLRYLRKTVTIDLMDIEKVDYERATTLKRHVQVPESYGSLTIYTENKQYYISDVEDVEEVYVVLMAYVKNRKEVM